MNSPALRDWRSLRKEVLRRIQSREWPPGTPIPKEADLAAEFGCARSTVNRALRSLAEDGLLERRRKAGTRVALTPSARAVLTIPLLREEIEARGQSYGYQRLRLESTLPPAAVSGPMGSDADRPLLHVLALHMADHRPYALEDRWIDPGVVPAALEEAFTQISPNEWLLRNAPYTSGEIAFSASQPDRMEAMALDCGGEEALFVIDRMTWYEARAITKVRLLFAPGYRVRTAL